MKPQVAFVDHSFHKKTHSFDFFRKILSDNVEIDDLWDDHWKGGGRVKINILNRYQYIVFAQSINEYKDLKKIKGKIIWLPMYDNETTSIYRLDRALYYKLLASIPIRVICFSEKVYKRFVTLGLDCLLVKYYLNPSGYKKVSDYQSKRIFLWDRGNISFQDAKNIIGKQKIGRFILKIDYDPGLKNKMPSKKDIKQYNLEIIEGAIPKDKYLEILSRANIFICPRKKEGIGMSFLEAMAMGQLVIAHNDSTMNEYIESAKNGILIDNWDDEIDLTNFNKMGIEARKTCEQGYKNWQSSHDKIISFMLSSKKNKRRGPVEDRGLYLLWQVLDKFYKIIMPLYQFLRGSREQI